MPTTLLLRPNAVAVAGTGWSASGAASMDAATADGTESVPDDSSYARNGTTFTRLLLALDNPSLPGAGERITGVHVRTRAWADLVPSTERALRVRLEVNGLEHPQLDWWDPLELGSAAATTYIGAVRTRAPDGDYWDAASLQAMRVQIEPALDVGVNVSEVFVRVSYVEAPVLTITTPSGTQLTTRPEGTATFSHVDGQPMTHWQVRIFTATTAALPGFDPATSPAVYDTGVRDGATLTHTPDQHILNGSYVWYWRAAITTLGQPHWSAWDSSAFTVALDQPSTPILTGSPDSSSGFVQLLFTDTNNLLGRQEADLEDAVLGVATWSGAFNNANVARSTAQHDHGTASLQITVVANGDASVFPLYLSRVKAGQTYTAQGKMRAATTTRNSDVILRFYAADGTTQVGADQVGTQVSVTSAGFVFEQSIAVAPAGAEYARPLYRIKSALAGEVFYLDSVKLAPSLSTWSRGGLVGRNLLTLDESIVEASIGSWAARTNCTVAQSTAQAAEGTHSLELTATATGGMSIWAAAKPCAAGDELTALARFRADTTARQCAAGIQFFDANLNSLGVFTGTQAADTNTGWTAYSCTATAPDGATLATPVPQVFGCAAGEKHYADLFSLSHDPSTVFTVGGSDVVITPEIVWTDDDPSIPDDEATWAPVRFTEQLALDAAKTVTVRDHEAPPIATRRYRARMTALEAGIHLAGDWSPTLTITLPTDVWWIKVPELPDLNLGGVQVLGPLKFKRRQNVGVFQELPDPDTATPTYPTVIYGGTTGQEAELRILVQGLEDWQTLDALLLSGRTLLIVSPYGDLFYVAVTTEPDVELSGPVDAQRRLVSVTVEQVARPAELAA